MKNMFWAINNKTNIGGSRVSRALLLRVRVHEKTASDGPAILLLFITLGVMFTVRQYYKSRGSF